MLLVRNFESTKIPRESLLNTYDCCLAHPTPSHTPSGASLISGAVVACEELQLSASEVQTFSWGLFLVSFCVPQNFRPVSTAAAPNLKVEV